MALLIVVGVKYGIGEHPNGFRFAHAVDVWPRMADSLLAVGDRALLSNAAPSWIAGAIGLPGSAYLGFSLVLTAVALCLPLAMRQGPADSPFRRATLLVLVGGALAPVLLMWVGGYDALVVIGMTIGALARTPWVCGLGWLLAAVGHSSVAIPAAAVWLLFLLLTTTSDRRPLVVRATTTGAGLVIGWIGVRLVTDAWGGSTDRLALFQSIPYHLILDSYRSAWPVIVLAGLGITWVLVAMPTLRIQRGTRIFVALATGVIVLVPLIAVDQTRIIALLLVPVTLAWLDATTWPTTLATRRWPAVLIAAVLLPVPVVWMGVSHWPYWL